MLYHVHHVTNEGVDTVKESFVSFETAKRLAVDLIAVYGGETYVTRAGLIQWDSNVASPRR